MPSIAAANTPHPNGGIGAYSANNGTFARFFYQTTDNAIHRVDGPDNWGANTKVNPPTGGSAYKPGAALACIGWNEGTYTNNLSFYISANNTVRTWGNQNGSAVNSEVANPAVAAAPNSKLSAFEYLNGGVRHVRLYYQDADGNIKELASDSTSFNNFQAVSTIGVGAPGTALAFINRGVLLSGAPDVRGYYQSKSLEIVEAVSNGGPWTIAPLIKGGVPVGDATTNIAATIVPESGRMDVYYTKKDSNSAGSTLIQATWDGAWLGAVLLPYLASGTNSQLAAITFKSATGGYRTTLFFLAPDGTIYEAANKNNAWVT